jgi:hypothetical protein
MCLHGTLQNVVDQFPRSNNAVSLVRDFLPGKERGKCVWQVASAKAKLVQSKRMKFPEEERLSLQASPFSSFSLFVNDSSQILCSVENSLIIRFRTIPIKLIHFQKNKIFPATRGNFQKRLFLFTFFLLSTR